MGSFALVRSMGVYDGGEAPCSISLISEGQWAALARLQAAGGGRMTMPAMPSGLGHAMPDGGARGSNLLGGIRKRPAAETHARWIC